MALRAFVLLDCVSGKAHEVVETLRGLPGVETADAVAGTYDAIVCVRTASMADLAELLSNQIALLPGVLHTATHVVVENTGDGAGDTMEGLRSRIPGPRPSGNGTQTERRAIRRDTRTRLA